MAAPRLLDRSPVAAEDLNPAKMARADGAVDVGAARGTVPPQPLQSASLHGSQAERGYLLPAQPVLSPHVAVPAPVQHQQQQHQPPTWAYGAAAFGSQQYPALAQGADSVGAWDAARQHAAQMPPPPPPDPPPHEPSAGGWAAEGTLAEPWQHNQPPLQTTGSVETERAFQHEAGSARAHTWSMHRTPGA